MVAEIAIVILLIKSLDAKSRLNFHYWDFSTESFWFESFLEKRTSSSLYQFQKKREKSLWEIDHHWSFKKPISKQISSKNRHQKNQRMRLTKFFDKNSRKKNFFFFISSLKSFFFQKRNTKAKEQCYKSFPMKCEWREISRLRRLKKCLGACIIKFSDLDSKTLLSFFSRLAWHKS